MGNDISERSKTRIQILIAEYERVWQHYEMTTESHRHVTDFHLATSVILISTISLGAGLGLEISAPVLLALAIVVSVWGFIIQSILIKNRSDFVYELYIINSIRKRLSAEGHDVLKPDVAAFPKPPLLMRFYSVWMYRVYLVIATSGLLALVCGLLAFTDSVFEMDYLQLTVSGAGLCVVTVLFLFLLFTRGMTDILVVHYQIIGRYVSGLEESDPDRANMDLLAQNDKDALGKITRRLAALDGAGALLFILSFLIWIHAASGVFLLLGILFTMLCVFQIYAIFRVKSIEWNQNDLTTIRIGSS